VGEKESGTIEQINVTPVKKWQFILAKLIPYWLIGMVVNDAVHHPAGSSTASPARATCCGPICMALLLAFFFSGFGLCVSN
jgi:ABC-2 type transport system permease protein